MRTAATIDKQINKYLVKLDSDQKKALLTMAKTFARENTATEYSGEFKAELDSRYEDYMNGGKVFSEEEVDEYITRTVSDKAKK